MNVSLIYLNIKKKGFDNNRFSFDGISLKYVDKKKYFQNLS